MARPRNLTTGLEAASGSAPDRVVIARGAESVVSGFVQTDVQTLVETTSARIGDSDRRPDINEVLNRCSTPIGDGRSDGQRTERLRCSADVGEDVGAVGGRVRTSATLGEQCRVGLGNRCSIP
jgi:hypothetical protein